MSSLMPPGEDLRRAIKWISENLEGKSPAPRLKLIEEAVFRFDLSPREAEFLLNFFQKKCLPPDE